MSTLNVIGESLVNWEYEVTLAAARELAEALADSAPRGHASALLIAADTPQPQIENPKSRVERIPLRRNMLPIMWHSSQAARPLDGEFVHAFSPLVPVRTREENDGSQVTVMIPHTLAWDAPEALPKGQARTLRSFTRRAIKHADVILTPTHTVADKLVSVYGEAIEPQVLPFATPSELLGSEDAAERRQDLGLPEKYILTTAAPGEIGRLEWVLRALEENVSLPNVVVVNQGGNFDTSTWPVLQDRVTVLDLKHLSDLGDILQGATALAVPQMFGDSLYPVYGALSQGIPVVRGDNACVAEITLDASVGGSEEEFTAALKLVTSDSEERERLSVLASDRSRSFSWQQTAWMLWEIHANI